MPGPVHQIGVSQSGAAGTRATQTGSPKGEARGSERIKRPTNPIPLFATGFDGRDLGEIGWQLVRGKVFNIHFDQADEGAAQIRFRLAAAIDNRISLQGQVAFL